MMNAGSQILQAKVQGAQKEHADLREPPPPLPFYKDSSKIKDEAHLEVRPYSQIFATQQLTFTDEH